MLMCVCVYKDRLIVLLHVYVHAGIFFMYYLVILSVHAVIHAALYLWYSESVCVCVCVCVCVV